MWWTSKTIPYELQGISLQVSFDQKGHTAQKYNIYIYHHGGVEGEGWGRGGVGWGGGGGGEGWRRGRVPGNSW